MKNSQNIGKSGMKDDSPQLWQTSSIESWLWKPLTSPLETAAPTPAMNQREITREGRHVTHSEE